MKITLQEALDYLNKKLGLPSSSTDNNPIWFFYEMDKNQDGIIDPEEFDKDFDKDIMKQFQNLHLRIPLDQMGGNLRHTSRCNKMMTLM